MMMDVLLIRPWRRSLYDAAGVPVPPLGLLYLAAALREAGHHVRLQDRVGPRTPLDLSPADLVGIGGLAPTFRLALDLADRARAQGIPVVLGGPHATFTLEESLGAGRADYVVLGEGEETIVELADHLSGRRPGGPESIRGLAWRDGNGYRVNPPRPALRDLDRIPFPARDLLDPEPYARLTLDGSPATAIVTSRGCPHRCRFCVVPNLPHHAWRARSVPNVIREMEHVTETLGTRAFVFLDDNLTAGVPRLRRFCREILSRGLEVRWWCMSRADTLASHPDLPALMARAGCRTVFLGLESASDRTLNEYGKREEVETGARAVKLLAEHGIETLGSFMLGAPGESREDVEQTIRHALELDPAVAQFSVLTPYPGTPLFEDLEPRLLTRNWDLYDGTHGVFRHESFPPGTLDRLLVRAYRRFYLRPRRIFRRLGDRVGRAQILAVLRQLTGRQRPDPPPSPAPPLPFRPASGP